MFRCGNASYWESHAMWWGDRGDGKPFGGPYRREKDARAFVERGLREASEGAVSAKKPEGPPALPLGPVRGDEPAAAPQGAVEHKSRSGYSYTWVPVEGGGQAFRCRKASYWKGKRGWWGDRGDGSAFGGPFPREAKARIFAEGAMREAREKKKQAKEARAKAQQAAQEHAQEVRQEARDARQAARDVKAEAKAQGTWGDIPAEKREVAVGQVWAMKQAAYQDRQLLIVEIRKTTIVGLTRTGQDEPWDPTKRDVRDTPGLLRLYRLVGKDKVPKARRRR